MDIPGFQFIEEKPAPARFRAMAVAGIHIGEVTTRRFSTESSANEV